MNDCCSQVYANIIEKVIEKTRSLAEKRHAQDPGFDLKAAEWALVVAEDYLQTEELMHRLGWRECDEN